MNRKGQLSLFDALLFFLILTIASSGLFITTLQISKSNKNVDFNEDIQRCSDMLNSILVQTVENTIIIDTWAPGDEQFKNISYASTEELIGIYIHMSSSGRYNVSNLPVVIRNCFNMGLLNTRYGARCHFYDNNNSTNSITFNCWNSNRDPDLLGQVYVKNRMIYYLDVEIHLQFTCWHI